MPEIEDQLTTIRERNARVEADKAWEVSWLRRGLIAFVTYVCAVILLMILGHDGAFEHALVPVVGYLVSTLSLSPIKKIWIERRLKNVANGK